MQPINNATTNMSCADKKMSHTLENPFVMPVKKDPQAPSLSDSCDFAGRT